VTYNKKRELLFPPSIIRGANIRQVWDKIKENPKKPLIHKGLNIKWEFEVPSLKKLVNK